MRPPCSIQWPFLWSFRQVHSYRVHTDHLWSTLQRCNMHWQSCANVSLTGTTQPYQPHVKQKLLIPPRISSVSLQQRCQDSEPTSCYSDCYPRRTCFSDKGDTRDWVGGFENYMLVDMYRSKKKKKSSTQLNTQWFEDADYFLRDKRQFPSTITNRWNWKYPAGAICIVDQHQLLLSCISQDNF